MPMYVVYDALNGRFTNDQSLNITFGSNVRSPPKQVRTFYHFEFSNKSDPETETVFQSPPKSYCTGFVTFNGGKLTTHCTSRK
jgi:hypothetical protein